MFTRAFKLVVPLFVLTSLVACGGGGSQTQTSSEKITISVSPVSTTVTAGSSINTTFEATVTGSTNTAVTWTLSGAGCADVACGTITSLGVYSAPPVAPNPNTVTVTATAQADTTKKATAIATVNTDEQTTSNSMVGATVSYPQAWIVQANPDVNTMNISNVAALSPEDDATLTTESFFQILRLANVNSGNLSVAQWFDQNVATNASAPPLTRADVVVAGRNAVRIETSEIGRTVHIYVPNGSDIIAITYDLNSSMFIAEYERMVASLELQSSTAGLSGHNDPLRPETTTTQDAVDIATLQLGKPYLYGAKGPTQFDCSGLTQYSYAQVGITLPRQSADQAKAGDPVTGTPQRGDLLFFATDDTTPGVVTHVGILETGTTMIHAPGAGKTVVERDTELPYWKERFLFARRIPHETATGFWAGSYSVSICDTPGYVGSGDPCSYIVWSLHGGDAGFGSRTAGLYVGPNQANNVRYEQQFDGEFCSAGSGVDLSTAGSWEDTEDLTNVFLNGAQSVTLTFTVTQQTPTLVSGTFAGSFAYPASSGTAQGQITGRWSLSPLSAAFPKCITNGYEWCYENGIAVNALSGTGVNGSCPFLDPAAPAPPGEWQLP